MDNILNAPVGETATGSWQDSAQGNKTYEQKNEDLQRELIQAEKDYEEKIIRSTEKWSEKLIQVVDSWSNKLIQVDKDWRDRTLQAENVYQNTLDQKESAYQEKLNLMETTHQDKLNYAKSAYQEKLSQAESAYQEKLHQTESAYQEKLSQAESAYQEKLSQAESANQEKLNQIKNKYQDQLNQSDAAYQEDLKQKEKTYSEKIKQVEGKLQAELLKVKNDLKERENKIRDLEKISTEQQQKLKDDSNQITALMVKLKRSEVGKQMAEERYVLLANSKLGRVTLWYWKKKDAFIYQFKKGDPNAKTIRNFVKKIPGMRPLVLWLRKLKNKEKEAVPTLVAEKKSVPAVSVPVAEKKQISAAKTSAPPKNEAAAGETTAAVSAVNSPVTGDETFFERIKNKIDQIPESNGCRFYQKAKLRIGLICDQFYYDSVYSAANFIYLSPNEWEKVIDEGLDMLLVVSTWNGLKKQEWSGIAHEGTKRRQLAYTIIETCQAKEIPVAFYSKEDPPHYNDYIGIAKKCDFVFTTAEEKILDYIRDCGHDRVYSLRFGINPEYHNPVGMRHFPKEDAVIFSGSWMTKFVERCNDLAMIFDGLLSAGKEIKVIDRNYALHNDEWYKFPDKYFKYASPSIDHHQLQKVHKLYDWAVNINAVKTSQTMFANRVYELQATGNLLLSNYSVGVNSLLPTVFMVHECDEVQKILNGFSPEEVYERQISGIRKVMTGETCYDRVAELLEKVGISYEKPDCRVLVIADKVTDHVQSMFDNQTYQNKKLISRASAKKKIMRKYDVVAFFSDANEYDVFYLEDMVNGFKYTACDYITKEAFFKGDELQVGKEHEYTHTMGSKYRSVFWQEAFDSDALLKLGKDVSLPNGYAIDHFNYREGVASEPEQRDYKLSVILPIYNNGWHLYGKALASLRRSTMFKDMEILFIDDGSTDSFTPKMLRYLERMYPNVKTFFFGDGGSGSASRPRNKGIELATADHITYLDPDNEAVCDGYTALYQLAVDGDHDLTVGNIAVCSEKYVPHKYFFYFEKVYGNAHVLDNNGAFLRKTDFFAMSIQAMVAKRSLIVDNNLTQIVGAIGEDTIFSWELLTAAKNIYAIPLMIHLYYAATSGSTVNTIGSKFFKKYQICEEARIEWLLKKDLLSDYMKKKYNNYSKNWHLKNLAQAKELEAEECSRIVYEFLKLYDEWYDKKEPVVNEFLALCEKGSFRKAFEFVRETFYPSRKTKLFCGGNFQETEQGL